MTEQKRTLVKLAKSAYEKLIQMVGEPIPGESHEKFMLNISYDIKECNWIDKKGGYWEIPRYSNGTTRRAKCIFLIPPAYTGDGGYAYLVRDNSVMESRFLENDNYDRRRLLIKEEIDGKLVELIWSFDFGTPNKNGQYYYWIDKYWFGVVIDGELACKVDDIKKLKIPE